MATKKKLLQAAAGNAVGGFTAIEDVFSTYLYTGNGSGQVIQNGINLGQSFGSGSAEFSNYLDTYPVAINSYLTFTGDFTAEAFVLIRDRHSVNVCWLGSDYGDGVNTNNQLIINSSGYLAAYNEGPSTLSTASSQQMSLGTWYHVAISRSSGTIYFWVNGVSAGSASHGGTFKFKAIGALGGYSGAAVDGFMSNIRISNNARYTSGFTPPSGALSVDANTVLLALQTDNLFTDKVGTYTLTKSSAVSSSNFGPFNADTAGEGGLVWIKKRNGIDSHVFVDTDRGVGKIISSDATSAQFTASASVSSFNSDGFSLGNYGWVNAGGGPTYASWTFRKAPRFFDVVTYTGTGSSNPISHNLGVLPGCMIFKKTSAPEDWYIYNRNSSGTYFSAVLNSLNAAVGPYTTTDLQITDATFNPAPLGSNSNGATYVAYLFAHDPLGPSGDGSDGLIACGSYVGNTTTYPEINLGWEPQWVLIKRTDQGNNYANWCLMDNMRNLNHSFYNNILAANLSEAEGGGFLAGSYQVKANPNGFTVQANEQNVNATGSTYIYIAIRRGPMRPPESGSEVFAPNTATQAINSSSPPPATGFVTDLGIYKSRSSAASSWVWADRLRGAPYLSSNSTAAEATGAGFTFDRMDGWSLTAAAWDSSQSFGFWGFRRAPEFFDVVAYTGTGSARTVPHNLGVAPEMMIIKNRSAAASWAVFHTMTTSGYKLQFLNNTDAQLSYTYPSALVSQPTDTSFEVGGFGTVGDNANNYIAYLFASKAGVSKVGSYTGNGTSQTIDCGFTSGARFVLIKRTDSIGSWYVYDTARGIVAGNDSELELNTTNPEDASADAIDPHPSGFALTGSRNINGASYIFLAIA